jgi:2-methylcitrate dehydratase PrpD
VSLPYNVAILFFDREFGWGPEHFKRYEDPAVRALCKRVEVHTDASLDRLYPEKMAAYIEVATKCCERFSASVDYPKGEPENPMTKDELLAKFRKVASPTISKKGIEEIISSIQHLEEVKNVKEIIRLLCPKRTQR